MRSSSLLAYAMLGLASADSVADDVRFESRPRDLGAPGALERLAVENPAHYGAAIQVLDAARHERCDERIGVLKVELRMTRASCAHLLRTSYPAQRDVDFTLDGISYRATVHVDASGFRLRKAQR